MTPRIAACFAIATLMFAVARRSAADATIQIVFNTVDSVEVKNQVACLGCPLHALVIVTGIPTSSGTPFTRSFDFGTNLDMATRCEHLAVIAMSKPGKYQFGVGSDTDSGGHGDCKLILVTN
jgi:hypothetical protein